MSHASHRGLIAFVLGVSLLLPIRSIRAQEPTLGSDFEIAFTEKHPLSSKESLNERLGEAALDYDLSAERFIVYVNRES